MRTERTARIREPDFRRKHRWRSLPLPVRDRELGGRRPQMTAALLAELEDTLARVKAYREAPNIEFLGMGHYHPIFPLIPVEDWEEQLSYGRKRIAEVFGRDPEGFWPPEMAFMEEMVPAIVKAGYKPGEEVLLALDVTVEGVEPLPELPPGPAPTTHTFLPVSGALGKSSSTVVAPFNLIVMCLPTALM